MRLGSPGKGVRFVGFLFRGVCYVSTLEHGQSMKRGGSVHVRGLGGVVYCNPSRVVDWSSVVLPKRLVFTTLVVDVWWALLCL